MTKELYISKLDDSVTMSSEIICEYNYTYLKNKFEKFSI